MPTNKQRREAERRHLERQLRNRRMREERRRKTTLIISVAMTVVLIAAIVVTVVLLNSGNSKKNPAAAGGSPTKSTTSSAATTNPACPTGSKPQKVAAGTGKAVSFHGVTVKGATDMKNPPTVGSHATKPPRQLLVKDLVVGKGKPATPKSTVSVKYDGVLYCDGTEFDGPAEHGNKAISFSLQHVVPGFTEGIGGFKNIKPMRAGGRRLIIMPASLGYGATGQGSIPANAPLVFIVDLVAVKG